MEYKQYLTEHWTASGLVRLQYTYERASNLEAFVLDDLYVTLDNKPLAIPKAWQNQTSKTIIRKINAMLKKGVS